MLSYSFARYVPGEELFHRRPPFLSCEYDIGFSHFMHNFAGVLYNIDIRAEKTGRGSPPAVASLVALGLFVAVEDGDHGRLY